MFTGSTKLPPAKTPQPERLDEVYAALRRGLQSYLQVHQLELESLGQQIRENKRNGRLGSLYEQDKQVKAIERFMRRLEFHLSKVEELYDAYCIQRRLRDGASKMVAAFNSTTGSREARESLSEANKGYRECTEHMCSLESELESHMGEFHVKMKGLAGFARLCAGDQYEVLMRYGRQRWRLRGRVEVSNKQIWDSEEYIFLPLVTELLSIKVTELKSLANHVVVGSVSCEMLDLFCPLPQTLAVDINDLGTVKLNLEVTWSPFDKDDQTSSTSTVSKRLLSNQSPPDTPSMREQVFYSLLKRQGETENGTVWSNSSESSDDSSSPALAHHAQRLAASNVLQTPLAAPLSLMHYRKSGASTPSLSSNQEEDEAETGEVFTRAEAPVPNGHPQTPCPLVAESGADGASERSDTVSNASVDLGDSCPDVSAAPPAGGVDPSASDGGDVTKVQVSTQEDVLRETRAEEQSAAAAGEQEQQLETTEKNLSVKNSKPSEGTTMVPFPTSLSFTQEVETALESFDFLNCADLDEEDDSKDEGHEQADEKKEAEEDVKGEVEEDVKEEEETEEVKEEKMEETEEVKEEKEEEVKEEKEEEETEEVKEEKEEEVKEEEKVQEETGLQEESQNKMEDEIAEKEEKQEEKFYCGGSDEEEADGLEILMEAPEGFRNSDEDHFSESQESSVEDVQDLKDLEMPEEQQESAEEKGDEPHGEDTPHGGEEEVKEEEEEERRPSPSHSATPTM